MCTEGIACGEHAEGLAVIRINHRRFSSSACATTLSWRVTPPVMRQRPHHQIPRIHAVRRLSAGSEVLRRVELRFDRSNNGLGDLVLHCEYVREVTVKAFRPDLVPVATSLSCAVMRTRSPALRTLPSTT